MNYKVGDKVTIREDLKNYIEYGVYFAVDEMEKYRGKEAIITKVNYDYYLLNIDNEDWAWTDEMFKEEKRNDDMLKIRIKYFEGATKLKKIVKGNWIDVYANADVFVPLNEKALIPLGFALELPFGWEGHLAPRGSTFKTWGIIQTNHVGIIDDTFIGDNDQWHMPVYCLESKDVKSEEITDVYTDSANGVKNLAIGKKKDVKGTWIRKGDKIGQFRIMEVMPEIEFEEVEYFGNEDRGCFGSTGRK